MHIYAQLGYPWIQNHFLSHWLLLQIRTCECAQAYLLMSKMKDGGVQDVS